MDGITVKSIEEIEAYAGPQAIVGIRFRPARQALGVSSWGMSVLELDPHCSGYPEHDHAGDGQEEVYLALRGAGEVEIDGTRYPLDPETMVRVSAGTKRKIWPGEEGVRLLAIGGCPGKAYEAPEISELGSPDPLAQSQA